MVGARSMKWSQGATDADSRAKLNLETVALN